MGAACAGQQGPANSSATGNVKVYGMSISGNVIPPVLLALDYKCGNFELKDMMKGELKSPEMLAINPWHQMPSMSDGSVKLAESTAILRYIANTYAPGAYGGNDAVKKAEIDWACDWCATNFAPKNYSNIWYPVAGFGAAPDDQAKANEDAKQNLQTFAEKFLASSKFVGGTQLSIADYKIGTLVWYIGHPTIKKKVGYENSPRMKQYVEDWKAALSQPSRDFLKDGEGFMASKA